MKSISPRYIIKTKYMTYQQTLAKSKRRLPWIKQVTKKNKKNPDKTGKI